MVAVLRLRVTVVQDTQLFGHGVGIVLQVAPVLAGFEDHLHAFAAWSDEYTDDAQLVEVLTLEPLSYDGLHVRHMVTVHHGKARQVAVGLQSPQPNASPSVFTFDKVSDGGNDGRQRSLKLTNVKLHSLLVRSGHLLLPTTLILLQFLCQPRFVVVEAQYTVNKLLYSLTCLGLSHLAFHLSVVVNELDVRRMLHHALQSLFAEFLRRLVNVRLKYNHFLSPPIFLKLLITLLNLSEAGSRRTTSCT